MKKESSINIHDVCVIQTHLQMASNENLLRSSTFSSIRTVSKSDLKTGHTITLTHSLIPANVSLDLRLEFGTFQQK